jgi:RNA polymerase sigma factor (sigma-70 family)
VLDLSRLVLLGYQAAGAAAEGPDARHERGREIALLEAALAALPLASREVLLLVGVEGLEQEEVARVLGISYEAVRQRLHRARAQLDAKMRALEATADARATVKAKRTGEIA